MSNVTIQKQAPTKKNGGEAELSTRPETPVAPWNPYRTLRTLLEWDPFQAMAPLTEMMPQFSAAFDVKEDDKQYSFIADVPGIKPADLEISLSGNRLTISGKRDEKKEEKTENRYRQERSFGSFVRSFTLPDDANLDEIKADRSDGVLTITVQKKPGGGTKKIAIGEKH